MNKLIYWIKKYAFFVHAEGLLKTVPAIRMPAFWKHNGILTLITFELSVAQWTNEFIKSNCILNDDQNYKIKFQWPTIKTTLVSDLLTTTLISFMLKLLWCFSVLTSSTIRTFSVRQVAVPTSSLSCLWTVSPHTRWQMRLTWQVFIVTQQSTTILLNYSTEHWSILKWDKAFSDRPASSESVFI